MSNFKRFVIDKGLMSVKFFNDHKNKFNGNAATWRTLSIVAASLVGICMLKVLLSKEEGHKKNPEFVKYEHLRRRTKQFPWGDGNKSLFHNPKVNALPDGYER